jgi:hypothetical protein
VANEVAIRITADGKAVVIAAQDANAALGSISTHAGQTAQALGATQNASAGLNASLLDLGKAGAVFGVMSSMASGLADALARLPTSGIAFAAQTEVTRTGMAGILSSLTAINGQATSYVQAMAIAGDITAKLQRDAMMTAATTPELVNAFQAMVAPGLAAGMSLDNIRQLATTGVNAVKALGMSGSQVVQELRDLVQGGITPASSTLATALGLKDADIAKAKASSDGLFKFLMDRMSGFDEAGKAYTHTFRGTMENMEEQLVKSSAAIFAPLAEVLKVQAQGITDALGNDADIAKLSALTGSFQVMATALGQATQFAIQHSDAIVTVAQTYGALKFGVMAAGWQASTVAMLEASAASRLVAMQGSAEAVVNAEVTLTAREKIAAYLVELAAKEASAQATVAETGAKLSFLAAGVAALDMSRSEVVAKMASTRVTIAQAEAQLAAAKAAGAQSFALAMVTEATNTLAGAQVRQSALLSELARLGTQQASVQASIAAATAAQATATEAAAVATAQLGAAQQAASVSGGVFGSVVGALGGPVGIAIAAVSLLVLHLVDMNREANKAAGVGLKQDRVDANNAAGTKSESRDTSALDQQISALKDKRDELDQEKKKPGVGASIMSWLIGDDYEIGMQVQLKQIDTQITSLQSSATAAAAISNQSGTQVQLNSAAASKALDELLGKEKTVSALTAKAKDETSALDAALAAEKKNSNMDPKALADRESKVAEAKKAIQVKLNEDLKSLREKGMGEANAQANAHYAIAKAEAEKQTAVSRQGLEERDIVNEESYRNGLKSEAQYFADKLALQLQSNAAEQTAVQAEIAAKQAQLAKGGQTTVVRDGVQAALIALETKGIDLHTKALALNGAERLRLAKANETLLSTAYKEADSLDDRITKQREYNETIGLTKAQIDDLNATRLLAHAQDDEDHANILRSNADLSGNRDLILQLADAADVAAKKKRELAGLNATAGLSQAIADEAKKAEEAWAASSKSIGDGLYSAIAEGGESATKKLIKDMKEWFARLVLSPIIQPIAAFGASLLNPTAASAAGTAVNGAAAAVNGGAAVVNGSSLLSGIGGWFSNFGESATQALYSAGEKVYSMGFESLGKSMMGNIGEAGGFSAMADKLNMVGNGLGYLNATMLAAGGQWGAAVGAGIGTYFGGPLGSMVGQWVGSAIDNAFGGGHEYTTGAGIQGKFSGSGFSGSNYQTWQNDGSSGFFGIGGSGSSSGKNLSALDSSTTASFAMGFASIQVAAAGMAASLGLDAKKILSYSQDVSVALGSDAAANKKAVDAMFTSVADGIAVAVAPGILELSKSGETASVTLSRLSTSILQANAWLSMLRNRLFDVSMAGADAASKLADAFGGLDKLASSSQAFYDSYYSDAEKVANSQNAMTDALKAYGIALPESKQALRDVAASMDLNTVSGRAAYAVLLQLAPQFSDTAALVDKMATDTATAILKTVTANMRLVPVLDAAALSLGAVQDGVDVFVGGISQVHAVMLDTSSPVLTFNGHIESLSTGLTDAQQSALNLRDQITGLSGASGKAVIDFEGLAVALAGVDTTTFMATVGQVFDKLGTRISATVDAISAERVAVREAALSIVNPTQMSKQSILAGIAGINTKLPGNADLISANAALGAANATQTAAQSKAAVMAANMNNAQAVLSSAMSYAAALPATFDAARQQLYDAGSRHDIRVNSNAISGGAPDQSNTAFQYNASTNRLSNYDYMTTWGHGASEIDQFIAERGNSLAVLQAANGALAQSEVEVANAQRSFASASSMSAAANTAATQAATAQSAAAAAAAKALLDYQNALQNFAIDASKSVAKLTNLRLETVKYYEAQKALANLMSTSASNLLATVANYRFSQLSPESQAASLKAQFATAYSLAQASQGDGTVLASHADKLNSTLGPLIESLKATGQDSLISTFLAQSESVAQLLQDNAPQNYAAESNALLSDIDATLAALDASSKSAEQVISDAVRAGSDRTAKGLYAVIQALTGKSIPAFAGGGSHSGGARWVGEDGPELEVTGPSHIFNTTQLRSMSRSGNTERLEALVAEQSLQLEAMNYALRAIAVSSSLTARVLKRITPDGNSLQTVAAP